MALFKAMHGPSMPNYFLPEKRPDGVLHDTSISSDSDRPNDL